MEETPGRASLEKLGCRTPPQLHAGGVGRQQQQHEISLTFTAGPVCLCGVSSPSSVCEVVVVPYVVRAVTVMHVLLFVLHVCVL